MTKSESDSIRAGVLYWCDTSRSNIGTRFSDKVFRPVLVVALFGDYAAVYPCSSFRGDIEGSEWVGDVFGNAETHVIWGTGLYYAPKADLLPGGIPWREWKIWKKVAQAHIEADLQTLQTRHRERLTTPTALRSNQPAERFAASIESLLDAPLKAKLAAAPPPKPVPKPSPPSPSKPPPPPDEFVRAVENLRPEAIDKPEASDEIPFRSAYAKQSKKPRRKGRRQ